MATYTRVGDLVLEGVEPGAVYLLRDWHRNPYGDEHETLHVISKYRGGQIRGYIRPKDSGEPWKVRLPAYEGHWPEVDQAVANLIGEPLIDLKGARVAPQLDKPINMNWFHFVDMHSGGGRKTDWEHIVVEAPSEKAAAALLEERTGRDPWHVTCDCCGPDFSCPYPLGGDLKSVTAKLRELYPREPVLFLRADGTDGKEPKP